MSRNIYYVYLYVKDIDNSVFYVGKGKGRRAYRDTRNQYCENVKNKYDYHIIKVMENLSESDALEIERLLILHYREKYSKKLTNLTDGGLGTSGYRFPDELRRKVIEYRNDPNSPYQSDEFRKKISQKTLGELNGNYGNKWNDEMKQNLSQKKIGKNLLSENPNSKKIMCVETGVIYNSIKEAMIEYNVKYHASFTVALKHPTRTAGGMHWVLVE